MFIIRKKYVVNICFIFVLYRPTKFSSGRGVDLVGHFGAKCVKLITVLIL